MRPSFRPLFTTAIVALMLSLPSGERSGVRSESPLRDLLGVTASRAHAQASASDANQLSGLEIARRVLSRDPFGWEGSEAKLRMHIQRGEKQNTRSLVILGRRVGERLQTVVRFMDPPDVAGTAFLMTERDDGASEQYVYLPGLKRTRRIVGREREGSFMGSDFSYADFQRQDVQAADHERLPDEKLGGHTVYVLRSTPKASANSAYGKVEGWIRTSDFMPMRTRFYDKQGKLLKTLYARRIRDLEGQPVVVEARMQNHQTGGSTDLVVDSIEKRESLPDSAFSPNALERG